MMFRGCLRVVLISFCLIWSALGCVSTAKNNPTLSSDSSASAVSGSQKSTSRQVLKSYEQRSSVVDRLQEMAPASKIKGNETQKTQIDSVNVGQSSSENSALLSKRFEGTTLLIRSERWSEVLKETQLGWSRCLGQSEMAAEGCRLLGRARATAFARLGHLRDAMGIYDKLASESVSSTDALLFAGLLADAGSHKLCWQLAGTGLQWEPADARLDLFALQARCLRLDGLADNAREALSRGLREYPEHPLILLESAHLYLSEKKLTQGCALLERLYLQEFKDVAVFYNWGHCLVGRQDAAAARQVLNHARRQFPSERLWILLSGEVSYLEGNLNGARRDGLDYLAVSAAGDAFRAKAEGLIRSAQGE